MKQIYIALLFFCLVFTAFSLCAEEAESDSSSVVSGPFFYHNLGYGSDASFNPFSAILNGGFYISLSDDNKSKLNYIDYGVAGKNLFYNLSHPIENIRIIGLKKFISTEVVPLSFKKESAQYLPNWTLHLIGCGSDFRAIIGMEQSQEPSGTCFNCFTLLCGGPNTQ